VRAEDARSMRRGPGEQPAQVVGRWCLANDNLAQ